MPDLLRQLPIKRRLGTVIQLWLEVHSAIPYPIGLRFLRAGASLNQYRVVPSRVGERPHLDVVSLVFAHLHGVLQVPSRGWHIRTGSARSRSEEHTSELQ